VYRNHTRRIIVLLLSGWFSFSAFPVDVGLIDPAVFLDIDEVADELSIISEEEDNLLGYIPDDFWSTDRSKAEYIEILHRVLEALLSTESHQVSDLDFLLFEGLINLYLHNLDDKGAFLRSEAALTQAVEIGEDDYRARWFLADLYAKSALPVQSIREYEYIASRISANQLHPLFWSDYAFAAYVSGMPGRARNYLLNWSDISGLAPEEHSLWQGVEQFLPELPRNREISPDELFENRKIDGHQGILSYPFAIWMPVREDWNIRPLPFTGENGAIMFQSERIRDESGRGISYSILVVVYLGNPRGAESLLENFANARPVEGRGKLPEDIRLYEFSDPSMYPEAGGGRGMLAILHREGSGSYSFERPSLPPGMDESEGLSYFKPRPQYIRPEGMISYIILLDTAGNIYERSLEDYYQFLSGMIID
jgi:hypothetical protein